MHAEAGRRVHFADAAADGLVAFGDIGGEKIHATHIEADRADRAHRHVAVVGVDHVGDVGRGAAGGEIGGGAQEHGFAGLGHRLGGVTHALHHHFCLGVEHDAGQHFFMADAAARIGIHRIDQLRDGLRTVADHVAGRAARGGHEFAVDHEKAVIVATEKILHDHRARNFARLVEARDDFLVGHQVNRDAATVIAVERLGHHRHAEPARGAQRALFRRDQLLLGYRQAERGENLVGLFLVAGQLHRDMRRAAGDGGLDALLVFAVTELHQRLPVQAQPGNVAFLRRVHQRGGRRAKRATLRIANEFVARARPFPAFGHAVARAQFFRQQG